MIEATADNQPLALLLDLSGNERAAHQWATSHLKSLRLQTLSKAELKWSSKRQALARIRTINPEIFAIFTGNLDLQSSRCAMFLFGALAGAKRVIFADRKGRMIARSRPGVFLLEGPRFALELFVGYLVIVPLSWLLIILLSALFRFRPRQPAYSTNDATTQSALYIRATLSDAKEGGMATHVAGFASGVRELGHHLDFLICGEPDDAPVTGGKPHTISPSATISPARAIFELWNNLIFTIQALGCLRRYRKSGKRFDFLYQRYNRFTFAGVVMSLWAGLPLALEFNGSEVWISQSWDPVGQLSLLKRFERLNVRAAAFIFTVSEVERRNLILAGVDAEKIIVNPNGVDVNRFHPCTGGEEIRRRHNIDRQIVIGFLGTFGPWHGAPVLAEAATRLDANCHLLFIGDGDERPITEEKLGKTKSRATFVGRITHAEVPAYLDACDILVAPHVPASDGSDFFGSPTKLFEYMAMEKAVVASRLGQIADVITDGENGLLVPPNDSAALAAAIEKLANDEGLRLRLGRAARQTVMENYTWRDNAARVFAAIKNGKGGSANEDDGRSRLAM
jgi:glycosyltransferase involved in cell wall biosynthesis